MIVGMLCSNGASSQSSDNLFDSRSSKNYSVIPNPTSTHQWFISGGVFDGQSTGPSVYVTWDLMKRYYKIGVQETSAAGCKSDTVWHITENE